MKTKPRQPSLFDSIESREDIDLDQATALCASDASEWQEVSAAVFFSWSALRQLDYAARRDEDGLLHAESDGWVVFYGRRAEGYRAELARLLTES